MQYRRLDYSVRALINFSRSPIMACMRTLLCVFLVLATALAANAGDARKDLQEQLAVAERRDPPDNAAAAEITRRILEIDPHDQSIREKRVRALYNLGDLKRCGEELDAWNHEDKQISIAATDLEGDLADAEGKYDQALQSWNAYVLLQPRATKTCEKIAWLYERENHWDKADGTLTKLIAVKDSAATRVWRARCRMEMRHWDDAVADINKANQLDAGDPDVKQWLPQFETLEASLSKIKAFDGRIARHPEAVPLLDRGLLFHDAGRDDLALQDADAAVAIAPGSRRAILQKAQALIALGRGDDAAKLRVIVANDFDEKPLQAIGVLDAKIAAKPRDAGLLTLRARACSDIDQYGLALEDARQAAQLDPKSADALVEVGFAEMKLDDLHKAAKDFTHATELDPKNAVAWRSLGEMAMDRADYPAAIDNFTRSLKLHPSPLVFQKRGECYRNSGHKKEADEDLQLSKKAPAPSIPFVNKK